MPISIFKNIMRLLLLNFSFTILYKINNLCMYRSGFMYQKFPILVVLYTSFSKLYCCRPLRPQLTSGTVNKIITVPTSVCPTSSTVNNNSACQHVKLRNPHNFVSSERFRWLWCLEAYIVCGFSHPSSIFRRCNRLSANFRVWH